MFVAGAMLSAISPEKMSVLTDFWVLLGWVSSSIPTDGGASTNENADAPGRFTPSTGTSSSGTSVIKPNALLLGGLSITGSDGAFVGCEKHKPEKRSLEGACFSMGGEVFAAGLMNPDCNVGGAEVLSF